MSSSNLLQLCIYINLIKKGSCYSVQLNYNMFSRVEMFYYKVLHAVIATTDIIWFVILYGLCYYVVCDIMWFVILCGL